MESIQSKPGPQTVEETIASIIEFHEREAKGPGPIWAKASANVVYMLKNYKEQGVDIPELIKLFRKHAKDCGQMTVSATYFGAANSLSSALRLSAKRASAA